MSCFHFVELVGESAAAMVFLLTTLRSSPASRCPDYLALFRRSETKQG